MTDGMAQIYDAETGQVTSIPIRELSDAMIAIRIEGIEGMVYVDQSLVQLEKDPIRHEELAPELVERIGSLALIFTDVLPGTTEEWVEDFRRDTEPESELALWEHIADRYLHHVDVDDPIERKQDVLKVLLTCANNSAHVAAITVECETLDREAIHAICDEWLSHR